MGQSVRATVDGEGVGSKSLTTIFSRIRLRLCANNGEEKVNWNPPQGEAKHDGVCVLGADEVVAEEERGSRVPQIIAAVTANLVTMVAGCVSGWSAPVLPRLTAEDSWLPITAAQGSWIGSLVALGAAIGPFPGGYLADRVGRKWTLLGLAMPLLVGWILVTTAVNVEMIYAGRFTAGVAIGGIFAVAPMYVGEISQDNVRGALGSLLHAFSSAGFLFVYVIGPYVSYVWLSVASLIILLIFLVTFVFMPDSPYYLIGEGKIEEAFKSLAWLRGKSRPAVAKELELIKQSVEETRQLAASFKELVGTRANAKALYLSLGLIAFHELSGIDAILFYSTDIFKMSGGSVSEDVSTIVIGAVLTMMAFVAPLFVDRFGRRTVMLASATGNAASLLILGAFFYVKDVQNADLSSIGWLPIATLVSYIAIFSFGIGPLPWAIMGELFATNVKGIGSACTASFCWFLCFLVTRFFSSVVISLGTHTAFWGFAACCLLCNVFVYFLLPETKGRSLQEIQDILNGK